MGSGRVGDKDEEDQEEKLGRDKRCPGILEEMVKEQPENDESSSQCIALPSGMESGIEVGKSQQSDRSDKRKE